MSEIIKGTWIEFWLQEAKYTRKTQEWCVFTLNGEELLGEIKWFGRWRKYCFFPLEETVYEEKCLREIAIFIERLTQWHKYPKEKLPQFKDIIGLFNKK